MREYFILRIIKELFPSLQNNKDNNLSEKAIKLARTLPATAQELQKIKDKNPDWSWGQVVNYIKIRKTFQI